MRLISWTLSLLVFTATIVFVLQNRMQVSISFWPFDAEATLPVSILSLGVLVVGFLMGSLLSSLLNLGSVLENRRLKKEVAALRSKLEKAEEQAAMALASGPTILSHGRYQPVPPAPPEKKRRWFERKK